MKTICIFLAEGFEEMEAMFPLDVMRRGGLNVKTVSVTGEKTVVSSHQVPIVADMLFEDLKEEDVEMVLDLLMIAKYLERIGDHAENVAEWVVYLLTGEHV